jgi:hypothetical protein
MVDTIGKWSVGMHCMYELSIGNRLKLITDLQMGQFFRRQIYTFSTVTCI